MFTCFTLTQSNEELTQHQCCPYLIKTRVLDEDRKALVCNKYLFT